MLAKTKKQPKDKSKALRQKIQATRTAKFGWSRDEFYGLMQDWGYGDSLTALSYDRLLSLQATMHGSQNKNYTAFQFDKQGNYMWSLLKQAGWDRKRLAQYLLKRFKKSHWNKLNDNEKRGVIRMLTKYAETNKKEKK